MLRKILKVSLRPAKATFARVKRLKEYKRQSPIVSEDEHVADEEDKTLPVGWTEFPSSPPCSLMSYAMRELMISVPLGARAEVREMLGLPAQLNEVKSLYASIPPDASDEEAAEAMHSVGVRCCPVCDGLDPECKVQRALNKLWDENPSPVKEDQIFASPVSWVAVVDPFETA